MIAPDISGPAQALVVDEAQRAVWASAATAVCDRYDDTKAAYAPGRERASLTRIADPAVRSVALLLHRRYGIDPQVRLLLAQADEENAVAEESLWLMEFGHTVEMAEAMARQKFASIQAFRLAELAQHVYRAAPTPVLRPASPRRDHSRTRPRSRGRRAQASRSSAASGDSGGDGPGEPPPPANGRRHDDVRGLACPA